MTAPRTCQAHGMGDDDRGSREEDQATPGDAGRTRVPWWSRAPEGAAAELRERRNGTFLVQFYVVIPLMVVGMFLPDPFQKVWILLVIGGFAVWLIVRFLRGGGRGRAPDGTRGPAEDDPSRHAAGRDAPSA
jgi:hypothetical protein